MNLAKTICKKVCEHYDQLSVERQEKATKNLIYGASAIIGGVIGTIDVLCTELPILTAGIPLWEFAQTLQGQTYIKENNLESLLPFDNTVQAVKHSLRTHTAYALGAAIPFAINYHSEISDFLQNL